MASYSSDTLPTRIEYHSADLYNTDTMYNPADVRWDVLSDIMSSYYLHIYRIFGLNGVQSQHPPPTATHCTTAGSTRAESHTPTHPLWNNTTAGSRGRGARTPQLPQPPSITTGSTATTPVCSDSGIPSRSPPNPSPTMRAHVRDPHPGPTNKNASPPHTRRLVRDHHPGRTRSPSTTRTPQLTPSLVPVPPLGLTSAVATAKFRVT